MSQNINPSKRYNLSSGNAFNSTVKEIINKRESALKKPKPIFFKFFNDPNGHLPGKYSYRAGQQEGGTPKRTSESLKRLAIPGTTEIKKIQTNFEDNLEKVRNLKFTEIKKKVDTSNQRTVSKMGKGFKGPLDFPSFRRHKTESQEVMKEFPKHDFSNIDLNSNTRNSFSFKGTPRVEDSKTCINHDDKKAKYLLTTNSSPFFVCSKCAVKYANNGFALESIEDFFAKKNRNDGVNVSEFSILPSIFETLKPGFTQVKSAILEKKDEAVQFYAKQISKVENLFNSTLRIIHNHFDIAKKTVEVYKNRTLEKLELLNSDLDQNFQILHNLEFQLSKGNEGFQSPNITENVDKLKASLDCYFNEELVLYKFCTETSKMESIFNNMFPYHFIFPKYQPLIKRSLSQPELKEKGQNKRVSSFISNTGTKGLEILTQEESDSKKKNIVSVLEKINENQEKNNQYYMKILRGGNLSSPKNKNKTFAFPFQEPPHEISFKNRSMQLFPESNIKSMIPINGNIYSKPQFERDERAYIIFEENSDGVDLRCYEKRSSLSSPNFHS